MLSVARLDEIYIYLDDRIVMRSMEEGRWEDRSGRIEVEGKDRAWKDERTRK